MASPRGASLTRQPRAVTPGIPDEPEAPPAAPTSMFEEIEENNENAVPFGAAATSSPRGAPEQVHQVVSAHAIPESSASAAAAAAMGIDPETGKPNHVSYAGFDGIQTHYREIYNSMSDTTNAELLAPVMAIARPDPVPNQTFQSAWGDSLKSGPDTLKMWSENCMKTSKQCFDAPVAAAAAAVSGVGEDKARQRDNFHKNVVGSRLYYGDMLGADAAKEMDEKLMTATAEEKEDLLSAFRDMHAGTAHERDLRVPLSHEQYRMGFQPSEVDTARRHEVAVNKERLTGPKIQPRAEAARNARKEQIRAAAQAEKERLYAGVKAREEKAAALKAVSGVCCDPRMKETKETFKSQFKIGWASKNTETVASSYQDLQCGNYNQVLATLKAGVEKETFGSSNNFNQITAPYGDVNYLGQEEPVRAYPIPKYLTKRRPSSAGGFGVTTSRMSYQPRGRAAMLQQARQAKEAAAASRSMRSHSTIPLGKQGLMDHPRHQQQTGYQLDYPWHESAGEQTLAPSTNPYESSIPRQ